MKFIKKQPLFVVVDVWASTEAFLLPFRRRLQSRPKRQQ